MHYVLTSALDLTEIINLRCPYQKQMDIQLAINGVGFHSAGSTQSQYLNYTGLLNSPNTERLIANFISDIDFASLYKIITHPLLIPRIDRDILLNAYQIPDSSQVLLTLERSVNWSDSVLSWFIQKKIKPQDISILNLLSDQDAQEILKKLRESQLSKMDALKACELASELLLLKMDLSVYFSATTWNEKTISDLTSLRYPISIKQNPINQVQLQWPRNISAQTKRIQDKMGFQVQFFVSHPDELNHALTQLEKMVPDWVNKIQRSNQ